MEHFTSYDGTALAYRRTGPGRPRHFPWLDDLAWFVAVIMAFLRS
jgi:hypothetical protein